MRSGVDGDGGAAKPLVDNGVLLQLRAKVVPDLLPAHHLTAIRLRNRLHTTAINRYAASSAQWPVFELN